MLAEVWLLSNTAAEAPAAASCTGNVEQQVEINRNTTELRGGQA